MFVFAQKRRNAKIHKSKIFTRLFVSERKQIAIIADEKSPMRISHRHFATSCSEKEISVKNHTDVLIFHTAFCAAGVTK
jgi:hypothetical protein